MKIKMNLQKFGAEPDFAPGTFIDTSVAGFDPKTAFADTEPTEVVETKVAEPEQDNKVEDVQGADEPSTSEEVDTAEVDEETSKEQAKDKNHPMNHTMREMRVNNKKYKELTKTTTETDALFAELAKASGFPDIKSAKEYAEKLTQMSQAKKYKETQDPSIMVDMVAQKVANMVQPQVTESVDVIAQDINEFNTFAKDYGYEIESFDDIKSLPNSDEMSKFISMGGSPVDAFKLANSDIIIQKQTKTIRQDAINKAKGYTHVEDKAKGGKVETSPVTEQEIAQWRDMFPNKTREQLIKDIKKWK